MRECIRLEAARCQGSLVAAGAVAQGIQEGEGGKAHWENQEEAEVWLKRPEGTQEEAAAEEAGCVHAMVWTLPRHQRTPGTEVGKLTCGTRRGAIRHGDVVVRVLLLFFSRHTRWRTIWHGNIVICVLCIHAIQSTRKYTGMNKCSPSSSSAGAAFLDDWP